MQPVRLSCAGYVVAFHSDSDEIDESEENGPEAVGKRAFDTLRRSLKDGNHLELESIKVGLRPMPEDGYPIVGFQDHVKGLYLTVMHSPIRWRR
ncbi:hypothetical protein [Paenibacillus taichungensis]